MTRQERVLVVDCQVFQTDTVRRGIGKYSLEFLAHTRSSLPYDDVVLLFNSDLPLSDDVRETVLTRIPDVRTISVGLQTSDSVKAARARAANTKALDSALATAGLRGADFFVLAAFLSPGPVSVFPTAVGRKLLLFYDLIPLLNHANYLSTPEARSGYLPQLGTVFDADLILTISQSSADELAVYTGVPEGRIANVGGAAVARGSLDSVPPPWFTAPRYVLFPTGQDYRKNNFRAVAGFERFLQRTHLSLKLVLTSRFAGYGKAELELLSDNLVFTDYVSESEMAWLYANAEAVLFASESEGLGLPVLEGVEAGKPVVCSDIAPFREMSADAFYFFDPFSEEEIASALERALVTDRGSFERMRLRYPDIIAEFSWPEVAARVAAALKEPRPVVQVTERRRMAVLGPHPSGMSAIGKVIQEMHPTLTARFDVEYFFDMPRGAARLRPNYLGTVGSASPASDFGREQYERFDEVIYHLGNSPFHIHTAINALHLPGHAILHDTDLGFLYDALVAHGLVSSARHDAEKALQAQLGLARSNCIISLVNGQHSVIVHSDYARHAVQEALLEPVPCHVLHLPIGTAAVRRHAERSDVRVGLAGILAPIKGLDVVRRLALDPRFADVRFDVFGQGRSDNPCVMAMTVLPNVAVGINLTDTQYQQSLASVDILISYRIGYRGETSLAVLESMRYGVVNLVRAGLGWFDELPDDAVIKVGSEAELAEALDLLIRDRSRREEIGSLAQEFIRTRHSHEAYVADLERICAVPKTRGVSTASLPARGLRGAVVRSGRAFTASGHTGVRRWRSTTAVKFPPPSPVNVTSVGAGLLAVPPDPTSISAVRTKILPPIRRKAQSVRRSRAVARSDFDQVWFTKWAQNLGEHFQVHRKLWEWCEVMQAALEADAMRPALSACGFQAGREPIPAALANLGLQVLVVDSAADRLDGLFRPHVDPAVVRRNVQLHQTDPRDDLSSVGRHSLVWSSGVAGKLGSAATGLGFLRRSLDLLEPRGVAVHTVDIHLMPRGKSAREGSEVLLAPEDIRQFLKNLPPGFTFEAAFGIPLAAPEDCHIDLPPFPATTPHLKVLIGESITTSFVITVRRDAS